MSLCCFVFEVSVLTPELTPCRFSQDDKSPAGKSLGLGSQVHPPTGTVGNPFLASFIRIWGFFRLHFTFTSCGNKASLRFFDAE